MVDSCGAEVLKALQQPRSQEELFTLLLQAGVAEEWIRYVFPDFLRQLESAGLIQSQEGGNSNPRVSRRGGKDLRVLYLHLTERCDLACSYCYFVPTAREGRHLPVEVAQKALEEARELGASHIVVTGGEPLLHPGCFAILVHARKHGFFVELLTNGQAITAEMAQKLRKLCQRVTVSLDSANPTIHDKHRGQGTHARAVQTVRLLKEAGVPEVAVTAVITKDNQDEPAQVFRAFAKGLGADKVSRQVYVAQGDERDQLLMPDLARFVERLEGELEAQLQAGVYWDGEKRLIWRNHCGAGRGVLAVGADGKVYPCQALTRPEFIAGDLHEHTLREIYQDAPVLQRLRALTVDALEPCRRCPYRYLCGGGCRALAFNTSGFLEAPLPAGYCALQRLLCELTLWQHALSQLAEKQKE
ncbi:MAG: radical SAM protein [Candidatus Bipolaricaulota bacterium]|nr:radical SAM protein [Candidatus Bipolaricaulota bacterium]MDW8127491.1 radical SAM protein [Candidatus Bipolaricaulota bacterium]